MKTKSIYYNKKNITQVLIINGEEFVITELIGIDTKHQLLNVKGSFNIMEINKSQGKLIYKISDYDIHRYRFSEDIIEYSYEDKKIEVQIIYDK